MSDIPETPPPLDVIVVGGGPAGLSAALILARCRRSVLVCDAPGSDGASPRPVHGFLSRDGSDRAALLAIARRELTMYPDVEIREVEVVGATPTGGGFEVSLETGERKVSRKLLLATGISYEGPSVPGITELFGRGVFVCPICDGWEVRDTPLAVLGDPEVAVDLALELTRWSRDVLLLSDGHAGISTGDRERLARHGVWFREERVVGVVAAEDGDVHVRFASGGIVPRRALFLATDRHDRSQLAAELGPEPTAHGLVRTSEREPTGVPGSFTAGDASGHGGLAVVAAADGALTGMAINASLMRDELPGWQGSTCCGWRGLDGRASDAVRGVGARP